MHSLACPLLIFGLKEDEERLLAIVSAIRSTTFGLSKSELAAAIAAITSSTRVIFGVFKGLLLDDN